MYLSNVWSLPLDDGFTYCDYGGLRGVPLSFPHIQDLPDMTEAGIILSTNGHSISTSPNHHNPSPTTIPNGGAMVPHEVSPANPATTILTVRIIMQGKEVGSIIGKKGDNIKKFREDSGAKINISDGSCPERIVTVTGTTDNIYRAFGYICNKFEEDLQNTPTTPKPPVTLRLVVPASQCGSLIGKQGCKIKEIRESTGASIQVASEMLPNSTERAVTVSGTAEAITQCIKYVCGIMLESPPKGANLPYRPKPLLSPVYIPGSQGYSLPATIATIPSQEVGAQWMLEGQNFQLPKSYSVQVPQAIPYMPHGQTLVSGIPGSLVPINGLGPTVLPQLWTGPVSPTPPPSACFSLAPSIQYAARPASQLAQPAALTSPGQHAHEMTIPNDLIGCIIGRGGQKINEIRQISGANIKISNAEDGSSDRKVTISGSPECIGLAQYLMTSSMELHKSLTLDPVSMSSITGSLSPITGSLSPITGSLSSMTGSLSPLTPQPMTMAVMKSLPPSAMLGGMATLNGMASLGTMAGFNGMAGLNGMTHLVDPTTLGPHDPMPVPIACSMQSPTSLAGTKPLQTKMKIGLTATTGFKAAERPKFSPY